MNDSAQVQAYAEADFEAAHGSFIQYLRCRLAPEVSGLALDLGCGPGDITVRLARAFNHLTVHGADAAPRMLEWAKRRVSAEQLDDRVRFFLTHFPDVDGLYKGGYQLLVSNSLLHHLARPATLWKTLRLCGKSGAPWYIMDLLRPDSPASARDLVRRYAGDAPEILQADFYNSLCAAYRPAEVREQLALAGYPNATVEIVSDRHWIAHGCC